MRRVQLAGGVLAIVFATMTAALAENVVRWASATRVYTWEPTNGDLDSANGRFQVYEGLTAIDTHLELHPSLAASWTLVRPNTWRFELRQGVTFHDGTPVVPEDVVFSFERARAETSDQRGFASTIV